jgi:DNA-binding response OmpR family regulator
MKKNQSRDNTPPARGAKETMFFLVVDDDKCFVEMMMTALATQGNVDIALNGKEGLLKLEEQDYSLILSDVDMPIMDGFSFYLVATEKHPNTKGKFLFMTGNATDERVAFFRKHKTPYLTKPFMIKELFDAIESTRQPS